MIVKYGKLILVVFRTCYISSWRRLDPLKSASEYRNNEETFLYFFEQLENYLYKWEECFWFHQDTKSWCLVDSYPIIAKGWKQHTNFSKWDRVVSQPVE